MKVTYIDSMGTDLSVVNAARVSFAKKSKGYIITDHIKGTKELSKGDQGLINFLARGCTTKDWQALLDDIAAVGFDHVRLGDDGNDIYYDELEKYVNYARQMPDHWTPFGHTAITLHIKAPIFVARQLGKHQVGFVWNEVSRRYVTDEPEFYTPDVWRKSAENVKQGSSDAPAVGLHGFDIQSYADNLNRGAVTEYNNLLYHGVCPEQARMVLPQSMYTEWYWTGNLYGFANVFIQRSDSHAQKEVRDVAKQIGGIIEPLFPYSWKALTK